MSEPGHLLITRAPLQPNDFGYDIDLEYHVVNDPETGKAMHFRMHGAINGTAFTEEFELRRDMACNFASNCSHLAQKHGLPKRRISLQCTTNTMSCSKTSASASTSSPVRRCNLSPWHKGQRLTGRQRLVPGDHLEQLGIDAALAQAVEVTAQRLQQLLDVFIRPLHRRQAAGVLAGQ